MVKMMMLFAHYAVAEIAPQAEKLAGMLSDRVILFRGGSEAQKLPNVTLQELINEGLTKNPSFRELFFSSGTTGPRWI